MLVWTFTKQKPSLPLGIKGFFNGSWSLSLFSQWVRDSQSVMVTKIQIWELIKERALVVSGPVERTTLVTGLVFLQAHRFELT